MIGWQRGNIKIWVRWLDGSWFAELTCHYNHCAFCWVMINQVGGKQYREICFIFLKWCEARPVWWERNRWIVFYFTTYWPVALLSFDSGQSYPLLDFEGPVHRCCALTPVFFSDSWRDLPGETCFGVRNLSPLAVYMRSWAKLIILSRRLFSCFS